MMIHVEMANARLARSDAINSTVSGTIDITNSEADGGLIRDLDKGVNVRAAEKAAAVVGVTVAQVMKDYFRDRSLKPSSRRSIEGHVNKTALAPWRDTPIASLTVEMISKRFHQFERRGPTANLRRIMHNRHSEPSAL